MSFRFRLKKMLLINIIRAGGAWLVCSAFTDNNLIKVIFTAIIMFIVMWMDYDSRKRSIAAYEDALEEAMNTEAPKDIVITDLSDEPICRYLDKELPGWIVVNGDRYIFDGRWVTTCDHSFIDGDLVIMEPGVQYKLLPKEEHKNDAT